MDGFLPRATTRSTTRAILLASALAAAAFLPIVGCASGSISGRNTAVSYSSRPHTPRNIAPSTRAATYHGTTRSARAAATTTTVGLYGEVIRRPTPPTRFEGTGNLAQITAVTEGACFDPDIDRSGRRIVYASTQHRATADVYLKSTRGKTQRQITTDPADDVMPAFGPDGRRIAFASNRYGNWDVFITDTDGAAPMPITDATEDELHPTWSPDGKHVAYCRFGQQSGRWEVWVVDLASNVHQFLEYGLFPQWNPDPAKNKILFQRARERGSRLFSIWTIDYVDGEAMHRTEILAAANAAVMHPAWSPDGNRIVFVTVLDPDLQEAERPMQSDVWVVNLNGTGKANLTNGQYLNLYPVWSTDGTVYFLSDRSGIDNIWAVAAGSTTELRGFTDGELAATDPDLERSSDDP
jgi:TolB protein